MTCQEHTVRCNVSCNTLYDSSVKECVPNKTEDVSISYNNKNKWSKNIDKHILCDSKYKCDAKRCNTK